jgi:hypothetical protein
MFRKKSKLSRVTSIKQIKSKIREFILDSELPNAWDVTELMGCSAVSDEVALREEDESEKRRERIDYLLPLLYSYSAIYSEALNAVTVSAGNTKAKASPTAELHARKMMEEMMSHLLIGSVSQMIDLGLLEVPKRRKK